MSMQLNRNACRRHLDGLIALVVTACLLDSFSMVRANDHPVPSDTSTRKGVTASEEIQCQQASSPRSSKIQKVRESNAQDNVALAQWVTEWMKQPRRVTARLAIHGVVPEIEFEAVIPAAQQKICANGKCYEVDEKVVEGKPCDQSMPTDLDSEQEPIVEAPVAPPVPPSFPFALDCKEQDSAILEFQVEGSPYALGYLNQDDNGAGIENQDFYGSLSKLQVSVPASTLV
ncbi:MAG: hypothetical protein ACKN82_12810, partial [Pirellula sp.]